MNLIMYMLSSGEINGTWAGVVGIHLSTNHCPILMYESLDSHKFGT